MASCYENNTVRITNECNKFLKIQYTNTDSFFRYEYINKATARVSRQGDDHFGIHDGNTDLYFSLQEIANPLHSNLNDLLDKLFRMMCHSDSSIEPGNTKYDSFGRTRISNCVSLFSTQFNHGKEPLLFDEITTSSFGGTPSIDYITNPSPAVRLQLSTTGAAGENDDRCVFQTKKYMPFQPEATIFISISCALFTDQISSPDMVSRVGYYDDHNDKVAGADIGGCGVFFTRDGPSSFVLRTYNTTTNTQTDIKVLQTSWNIDQLDFYGNFSGTFDYTDLNIVCFELDRAGGRIRCGFNIKGSIRWCHQFNLQYDDDYIFRHSLPIRAEIFSTNPETKTAVPQYLTLYSVSAELCGTLNPSDGFGYQANPMTFCANSDTLCPKKLLSSSHHRPLISIRLKKEFCRTTIYPRRIDIDCHTGVVIKWNLILNPTGLTPTWQDVKTTHSHVEYSINDQNVTIGPDSIVLACGFISSVSVEDISELFKTIGLNSSISGDTTDVLSLTVEYVRGAATVHGSMMWVETR